MSLEYTIQRQGDTVTVFPEGDISLETVPALREILRSVVDSRNGGRIDVNLNAVTFLDSAGIGVLIAARRGAAAKDTTLMLCEPGPMIRMVLQIAGLDSLVAEPLSE